MERTHQDVTLLLAAMSAGDEEARDRAIALVYSELHLLAGSYMRKERQDHTLQATALVNEAWMRLANQDRVEWTGRAHFFGIAAQAMRRILVDHHRRRTAARRGGGEAPTLLDIHHLDDGADPLDLMELDQALEELAEMDHRAARIVELRYFGGLSVEESAEVLGISAPTVKRDWRAAKAWLFRRMGGDTERATSD